MAKVGEVKITIASIEASMQVHRKNQSLKRNN
jgi:hypothetical protein